MALSGYKPQFEAFEGPGRRAFAANNSLGGCNAELTGTDGLGCETSPEPRTKLELFRALSKCSNLLDLGIVLAWGSKAGLAPSGDRAEPSRAPRRKRGSLFPLPVQIHDLRYRWLEAVRTF